MRWWCTAPTARRVGMGGQLMSRSDAGTLSDSTTTCSRGLHNELHDSSRRPQLASLTAAGSYNMTRQRQRLAQ